MQARDRERQQAGSVQDRRRLLAAGSRALEVDGDLHVARRWFDGAYGVADGAGDQGAMAIAALGLGGLWVHEHRSVTAAATMQQRVRQALLAADPGSALAVRLRTRLAGEADYASGGHAAILAALKEATDSDDPVALADALSIAHHCVLGPEHGRLRRNLALQLIGVSSRTGRRSDRLMGLLWLTVDMYLDGAAHADRRLGELRAQLAVRDHLAVGYVVSALEVMLSIRAGRFEHAESLAAACRERGAKAGDPDADAWFVGHLWLSAGTRVAFRNSFRSSTSWRRRASSAPSTTRPTPRWRCQPPRPATGCGRPVRWPPCAGVTWRICRDPAVGWSP